jgi:hypothetical protein
LPALRHHHPRRQVELADAVGETAIIERGDRLAIATTGVMQGHNLIHEGQLLLLPLGFWDARQGLFTELTQVSMQALGGFSWVK